MSGTARVAWVLKDREDGTYWSKTHGWIDDRSVAHRFKSLDRARGAADGDDGTAVVRLTRGGKKGRQPSAFQREICREFDAATRAADRADYEASSGFFGGWKARAEHREHIIAASILADLLRGMWAARPFGAVPGFRYDRHWLRDLLGNWVTCGHDSPTGANGCSLPLHHPGPIHGWIGRLPMDEGMSRWWNDDGRWVADPRVKP